MTEEHVTVTGLQWQRPAQPMRRVDGTGLTPQVAMERGRPAGVAALSSDSAVLRAVLVARAPLTRYSPTRFGRSTRSSWSTLR